jgi:hypothetical protein
MMENLAEDRLRLWDLVRYCRYELHDAGLITDEEYAELACDGDSVVRLAYYCHRILTEHGVEPA